MDEDTQPDVRTRMSGPNGVDMWTAGRREQAMGTMELAVVGLAGSGVGTALGVPMVWPRTARTMDVRLMGGWLLATSCIAALISGRVLGLVPASAAVHHAINLVGFAAYPLLYLYIREQAGRRVSPAHARWLWAPAVVYVIVLTARRVFDTDTRVPFAWMLPVLAAFTVLCALAVFRSGARPVAGLVPARWLVAFLAALNLAQGTRMLFGHLPLVPAVVPAVMAAGFLMMVGFVVWRAIESRPVHAPGERGAPRYEKSGLDAAAAGTLREAVGHVLGANRLFTDPNLTLGGLASAAGATPHQVSEVLNRHAATSFHELVCRLRVEDVKAQLANPANDGYTIEGIGATSGFRSRSALYAAFRRLEGMTPTEYRARVRAQSSRAPVN